LFFSHAQSSSQLYGNDAIQSFEGCHSETLLVIVVVRELRQW
jgi:hypothetical protein